MLRNVYSSYENCPAVFEVSQPQHTNHMMFFLKTWDNVSLEEQVHAKLKQRSNPVLSLNDIVTPLRDFVTERGVLAGGLSKD